MNRIFTFCALGLLGVAPVSWAGGGGQNMLLVVNPEDENAVRIAGAYQQIRDIPDQNIVFIEPRTRYGLYNNHEPDLNGSFSYAETYLKPIQDHMDKHGLAGQIDYIAGLGQPTRVNNNNPASSSSLLTAISADFAYVQMDALLVPGARSTDVAGFWSSKTTAMYQDPATYALGTNSALHHNDTGLYMGGHAAFTGMFGNTVDQAIASFERTAAGDGTKPQGTIYFMENDDVRSNTREPQWPTTQAALDARGIAWIEERNTPGHTPLNRDDVRGAVIGFDRAVFPNGSTYLPGSWADNLTSSGANFDSPTQTKAAAAIAAGAAGSSGTVTEPYAISNRFTHSNIHVYSADGSTLGEAFYKSVATPDMQMFLGDMLAQPYADVPVVAFDASAPADGATVAGTVAIAAGASVTPSATTAGIAKLELYIDGSLVDTIVADQGAFNLDTTTLSDGQHEVRVVALNDSATQSQGYQLRHLQVNNDGRTSEIVGGNRTVAPDDVVQIALQATTGSSTVDRIELRHLGRTVGQVDDANGQADLDTTQLAYGDNQLVSVAIYDDGQEVAGQAITITRDRPWLTGTAVTAPASRTYGIKGEYFIGQGDRSIDDSDFTGDADIVTTHQTLKIGVPDVTRTGFTNSIGGVRVLDGVDPIGIATIDGEGNVTADVHNLAVRLSGRFEITADEAGEMTFFSLQSNDSMRVLVDGLSILEFNDAQNGVSSIGQGGSVFLSAGEHTLEVLTANRSLEVSGSRFDMGLYYRGIDGISRLVDDNWVYQVASNPEPGTLALLVGGVIGLVLRRPGDELEQPRC